MMNGLPDLACLRKSKGVTLEKIAGDTKISLRYLQAIEEGRRCDLPGGVYNNSYVRQYARAIDYNETELLAFFSTPTPALPAIETDAASLDWRLAVRAWATRRR